jgi:hypothetical protein
MPLSVIKAREPLGDRQCEKITKKREERVVVSNLSSGQKNELADKNPTPHSLLTDDKSIFL